jgi:hypothetical protein
LLKAIANKMYRGEPIAQRSPKSRLLKEMGEFVSQLFRIPIINDATVNQLSMFQKSILFFS